MIVMGYQGIGKSTLAGADNKCIDLESSNFFVDGVRNENWYKIYSQIALNLSKQGFIVFTSTHKVVRDEIIENKGEEDVIIITPNLSLKEQWIEKLKNRYDETGKEKDYKAYIGAKTFYEENINDLMSTEGANAIITITSMDYSLKDILYIF